ncbi:response regulator [Pusillimonas sp. ANT_WB101]|uniref:response regulator transcription factor n=1 Tax=Pusillimonas sp. ANT_WB101 TaxID=2597356 RepID=UPI0011ED7FE5|nr:response regulator [Pusillimonas sp. ANT_WB101]KAA0891099.1 response regulator [Pusillimonas sp. ANT_WB101]
MPNTNTKRPAPRILIVDDTPPEVRLLIERLRGTGYELSVALDGEQGYHRAIAIQPDLILLDVDMPKMDGLATCRLLKATESTASIPIIFLSAGNHIDQRLTALLGGACDYVVKPYDAEEVLARINIHLSLARQAKKNQSSVEDDVDPADAVGDGDEDKILVNAALNYISNNLRTAVSPEKIARLIGTHEKKLTQAFRRLQGVTVAEHIRLEKMRAAQRMLEQTALSVVTISEELGFSSAANFSSAFNRHSGMTPSLYRIQAKEAHKGLSAAAQIAELSNKTTQTT